MIYFTSDHHFYHANIIRYCKRPFANVEEMNTEMLRRWNSIVQPDDTVFYLGDFSLAKRPVEYFVPLLNGEKYLIMGNHDACHPCHKKKAALGREVFLKAGFKSLELERVIEIAGQPVLLSHMPYPVTRPESAPPLQPYDLKYMEFRPKNEGRWLLHGHVHEKWKVKEKMINVGVDVWDFYPVPISEIEKIICAQP